MSPGSGLRVTVSGPRIRVGVSNSTWIVTRHLYTNRPPGGRRTARTVVQLGCHRGTDSDSCPRCCPTGTTVPAPPPTALWGGCACPVTHRCMSLNAPACEEHPRARGGRHEALQQRIGAPTDCVTVTVLRASSALLSPMDSLPVRASMIARCRDCTVPRSALLRYVHMCRRHCGPCGLLPRTASSSLQCNGGRSPLQHSV